MAFSILTIPAAVSASNQVLATFSGNIDNASLEGRLLNMCIVDGGALKIRAVQSGMGLVRTPVNNTTQIALSTGVPTQVSLVGSFLESASVNFDMPSNSVLRFIGTDQPCRLKIHVLINMYATVNNQQIIVQLRRNGVNVNGATQTIFCSNGLITAQTASVEHLINSTTNDTYDVTITNNTANNPIIVYNMSITGVTSFS